MIELGAAIRFAFVLALSSVPDIGFAREAMPPYRRADAPVSERVGDLLQRMTLEEKVAQLESQSTIPAGPGAARLMRGNAIDPAVAASMLGSGIGTYVEIPGGPDTAVQLVTRRNAIQRWVMRHTRLGVPVLFHAEALHGAVVPGATLFPQAIALGSTWNRELLHKMFGRVARESRAAGNAMVLAPVFDLVRDPRYGRVEEMYSEDPYLAGELGVAAVQGLQGNGPGIDQDHVIATAKHFVHGQPENGTNVGPSDFSERTMRQIFLYPFRKAVQEGHIGAVMPSYNENNGGIPASTDSWLLKDVLRGEWGFTGLTVSDYYGVFRLAAEHRVAPDLPSAGVLAFQSGVDMELPNPTTYPALVEAVRAGKVPQADLDAAVGRVLAAKFSTGLFEHPLADPARTKRFVGAPEHAALAREVADEAIVLLKNDNRLLPLDTAQLRTLAVIGPNADKQRTGSYSGMPPYFVTVLEGIRKRADSGIKVTYAEGVRISEPDTAPLRNFTQPYRAPSEQRDRELIAEAVATARGADAVVLVLGGNEAVSRESFADLIGTGAPPNLGDSDTLELPGRQNELAREILGLDKPVVVVLLNGRPYSVEALAKTAPAIVEGWYLGQETGNAIAGVLFGDVNPSGRLPVTIARNVGQLPVYYYKTPSARLGYFANSNAPLYPFGFGLSYTDFAYGQPTLDRSQIAADGKARVSVTVTNTGGRRGKEVVQMYVRHMISSVVQPIMALRGFEKVGIEAGKSARVSFDIGRDEIAVLDRKMNWTVEPGKIDILIGPNSAQTAGVELTVTP